MRLQWRESTWLVLPRTRWAGPTRLWCQRADPNARGCLGHSLERLNGCVRWFSVLPWIQRFGPPCPAHCPGTKTARSVRRREPVRFLAWVRRNSAPMAVAGQVCVSRRTVPLGFVMTRRDWHRNRSPGCGGRHHEVRDAMLFHPVRRSK